MMQPAVYIVTNKKNGTLYTGVTSNLAKRIFEHKEGCIEGFTKRYGCKILVYYCLLENMEAAILMEKKIKAGSRCSKLSLIYGLNPDWNDLYYTII